MSPQKLTCAVCPLVARWRISVFLHRSGTARETLLCGRHAQPLRTGEKGQAQHTVLKVAQIEHVGFPTGERTSA